MRKNSASRVYVGTGLWIFRDQLRGKWTNLLLDLQVVGGLCFLYSVSPCKGLLMEVLQYNTPSRMRQCIGPRTFVALYRFLICFPHL